MLQRTIGLAVLAVALGCSAESAKPGTGGAASGGETATPAAGLTTALVKVTGMT